jgi:hypothetical protein
MQKRKLIGDRVAADLKLLCWFVCHRPELPLRHVPLCAVQPSPPVSFACPRFVRVPTFAVQLGLCRNLV